MPHHLILKPWLCLWGDSCSGFDSCELADLVLRASSDPFFSGAGLEYVPDGKARSILGRALTGCHDFTLCLQLIPYMHQHRLNLNAQEKIKRLEAIDMLRAIFDAAAECGAKAVSVCSGADPGIVQRSNAYTYLMDSVIRLAEEAQVRGLILVLEHGDRRGSGGRALLGPAAECLEFIDEVSCLVNSVKCGLDHLVCQANGEITASSAGVLSAYLLYLRFTLSLNYEQMLIANRDQLFRQLASQLIPCLKFDCFQNLSLGLPLRLSLPEKPDSPDLLYKLERSFLRCLLSAAGQSYQF